MRGAALLVSLREGLEISLILGIIFSHLRRLQRTNAHKYIWLGTALAAVLSGVLGVVQYKLTGDQEWNGQVYLETIIFLLAVTILSYMTFWMKKNSRAMNKGIQSRIDSALERGGVWQLVFLAFVTVIREVLELSMFLLAIAAGHSGFRVVLGGLLGLFVAALIGWGIYRGTSGVNLKMFFQVMGNLLIIVAAGLLGNAVHSLIEMGLLKPIWYVYDWTKVLNAHGVLGSILHAFIGYSDHPSVIQTVVWVLYLVVALILFNRSTPVAAGTRSR